MKKFYKPLAILGLVLTVLPPILLFVGIIGSLETVKTIMFVGMILWFAAAIPWLAFGKEELDHSTQDEI